MSKLILPFGLSAPSKKREILTSLAPAPLTNITLVDSKGRELRATPQEIRQAQSEGIKDADSFRVWLETAANQREGLAESLSANLGTDSAKRDLDAISRQRTHAKWNKRIAGMSTDASAYAIANLPDAQAIEKQSRECKKKIIAACEAIASNAMIKESALDGLMHVLVSGSKRNALSARPSQLSDRKLQAALGHSTTTQAGYLRRIMEFLQCAKAHKENGEFVTVFDYNAPVLKDLMNLYARFSA